MHSRIAPRAYRPSETLPTIARFATG
jgi:hypothetical protein